MPMAIHMLLSNTSRGAGVRETKCICKTLTHGHGDHCERPATESDGMCKLCHDNTPRVAQELLEDDQKEPLHLK